MLGIKHRELPIKGYLSIATMVLFNLLLWTVFYSSNLTSVRKPEQLFGEILGSTSLLLMVCALVLAARPKILEPLFGGLDVMYVVHRHVAIVTIVLVYIHSMVIGGALEKESIAKSLGGLSLDIMLYLSIWALIPRINTWLSPLVGLMRDKLKARNNGVPVHEDDNRKIVNNLKSLWLKFVNNYHFWQVGHKAMWVAFILALVHVFTVESLLRGGTCHFGFLLFVGTRGGWSVPVQIFRF